MEKRASSVGGTALSHDEERSVLFGYSQLRNTVQRAAAPWVMYRARKLELAALAMAFCAEWMFIPSLSYYSTLPGNIKGKERLGRVSGIKDKAIRLICAL